MMKCFPTSTVYFWQLVKCDLNCVKTYLKISQTQAYFLENKYSSAFKCIHIILILNINRTVNVVLLHGGFCTLIKDPPLNAPTIVL